jgi:hypothetical protein
LHAQAAKIESEGDGARGLQHRQFRGATDIDFAADDERQLGLAGVNGEDAAIENVIGRDAGSLRDGAAFHGNVRTLQAGDRAAWNALGASERRLQADQPKKNEQRQRGAVNVPTQAVVRHGF